MNHFIESRIREPLASERPGLREAPAGPSMMSKRSRTATTSALPGMPAVAGLEDAEVAEITELVPALGSNAMRPADPAGVLP